MEDRILAIKEFSKPENIQELRRFLGMINFYRRFMKDAAQVPLHSYLTGAKRKTKE